MKHPTFEVLTDLTLLLAKYAHPANESRQHIEYTAGLNEPRALIPEGNLRLYMHLL